MFKQTMLALAIALMIFTQGCANQAPPPAPTIPKIDWIMPAAPDYEKVTWSHHSWCNDPSAPESSHDDPSALELGCHCLDGANAKSLLINQERKNAYIEKLTIQLTAMKNTFDLLAETTNQPLPSP